MYFSLYMRTFWVKSEHKLQELQQASRLKTVFHCVQYKQFIKHFILINPIITHCSQSASLLLLIFLKPCVFLDEQLRARVDQCAMINKLLVVPFMGRRGKL